MRNFTYQNQEYSYTYDYEDVSHLKSEEYHVYTWNDFMDKKSELVTHVFQTYPITENTVYIQPLG